MMINKCIITTREWYYHKRLNDYYYYLTSTKYIPIYNTNNVLTFKKILDTEN